MGPMNKIRYFLAALFALCGLFAVYWAFKSPLSVILHPKGAIAVSELELINKNVILMLIILVPSLVIFLRTAWKYRSNNKKKTYDPDDSYSPLSEAALWIIPTVIIAAMVPITWKATRELDPYRPIQHEKQTMNIQVVALDWKWLFIYPEQGIATVNFVQFPEQTPIRFTLCGDKSPMNSFWIPQLAGQIYVMTGMKTILHMIANEPGEFAGKAAEINGEGYSGMTFTAKSTTDANFEEWVKSVKKSQGNLDQGTFNLLAEPSTFHPVTEYGQVDSDLFEKILSKPMQKHIHL